MALQMVVSCISPEIVFLACSSVKATLRTDPSYDIALMHG